jgi:hypothetical protein
VAYPASATATDGRDASFQREPDRPSPRLNSYRAASTLPGAARSSLETARGHLEPLAGDHRFDGQSDSNAEEHIEEWVDRRVQTDGIHRVIQAHGEVANGVVRKATAKRAGVEFVGHEGERVVRK